MSSSIKQMMVKLEEANNTLEEKVQIRTKEVELARYKVQSIIDNANDAIITINENQEIILFNPAASAIFGYSVNEIIGKPLTDLMPEVYRDSHLSYVNQFKEGSESNKQMQGRSTLQAKRKSGELFFVEVSISKQKLENEFQFTAFLKDITERKKAEEQILTQKKLLEDTIESLSYPFYVVDVKDYTIKMANSAAKRLGMKGITTCHALSHRSDTPCNSEKDPCPMVEVKKSKKPFKVEHIHFDENGKETYVEVHGYPIFDKNGEVVQMIEYSIDITERKEMELKIEEANKRMEDELNVGREIQMSMLPLIFPAFPDYSEFNIFALLEPAREVGGDFYDFFFIDEHRFLFSVADVSGKGVPSALFMAVCKTLIKSRASEDTSTASIITHVNDELSRENNSAMFVTLFLCIIDLRT
jgi:PAS domain S-box-containing protein